MTTDLAQKLQELKQLLDSGLLTPTEYERERETLLAAWRAAPASSVPAVSIDLNTLPTVVALPLREYLDETHPVLKLWYACDGVEMLLRLVVMMGLAVLSQRGPLTPKLRKRLQEYRLEEPTLGNWRALADAVMEALGDAPDPLPELPSLVRDTLAPLLLGPGESERDESNSFIRLRNRLAHGGGISRDLAQRLGEIWQPRLRALWEQLVWLAQVELVAQDGQGGYGVLRGSNPQAQPYTPRDAVALAQAFAAGDAVALTRDDALLPLWPLALYGPPRSPNPDTPPADEIVPQVYLRRGEVRLQYTPLGALAAGVSESEEHALERFLDWFKVADEPRARHGQFQVRDFTDEMRKDGLRLIGREQECETLKTAVAGRTEGVIWVSGKAGIGKSYLFAWLALRLLDEPPPDTLVLPYRFRAGDERCSREAFLRFAVERLAAWLNVEVEADSTPWLKRLRGLLEQLAGRRVVFLLDGLDEIAARDARFAQEAPLALTGSGILWVCAGRPEYDLPVVFAAAGALQPFLDGVPDMDAGDIRTLLLERIGPLRKHLLRHDQEQGERIGNPFVEKVAQAAAGVPLYVKYVIDDIFAGRYRVLDGHERLPPSLSAYYEELLRRLSVGDLHQVLTPLAATLAVALEPLDASALAALLYRRGKLVPEGAEGLRLVERGLSAIASMLKRAPTPAGQDGYTLYHLSLRQHMATSEHSRVAVATAREVLGDLALDVASDAAAPYLYRCGISHLLETHRAEKALGLLTRFEYVMDRLRTLTDSEAVGGLGEDWRATVQHVGPLDHEQRLWEAFWREREHILRRGDDRWPAYKILLQLAVEHADDSPVTRQAEAWLEAGHCDWVWLRNPQRIKYAAPNPCLRVFEGHTRQVYGALELKDGQILSWSMDDTLRLWDRESGEQLAVLDEHSFDSVNDALELPDGRIFLISIHLEQCLWDRVGRVYPAEDDYLQSWFEWRRAMHGKYYGEPRVEDDGLNLLGQSDRPSVEELAVLAGHTKGVRGALELRDGYILSWSIDGTLRLWDGASSGKLAVLARHTNRVNGVRELRDGHILSWSSDETLRLWDGASGREVAVLAGHTDRVYGALELRDGRILSWSADGTLRLWDGTSDVKPTVLLGHTGGVVGALELRNGRILSWSSDLLPTWSESDLRLWDGTSGREVAVLTGHTGEVGGALELWDGRILSWSEFDNALRLWDGMSGAKLVMLVWDAGQFKNGTFGVLELRDGRILSWSRDRMLRLWDAATGVEVAMLAGHTDRVEGALELRDGHLLSWSNDKTLWLWDGESEVEVAKLEGHTNWVQGAYELRDGRILSWSEDGALRLWDWHSEAELQIVKKVDAPWFAPDGLAAQQEVVNPQLVRGCFVGWDTSRMCGIADQTGLSSAIPVWHGDSETQARVLLSDGTLVVTLDSGHVFCLKLHHGARRITLAEWGELLAKTDRAPCETQSNATPAS